MTSHTQRDSGLIQFYKCKDFIYYFVDFLSLYNLIMLLLQRLNTRNNDFQRGPMEKKVKCKYDNAVPRTQISPTKNPPKNPFNI